MDENKWKWVEWADQYSSLSFEDGYMVLNFKKSPKNQPQIIKFGLPKGIVYTEETISDLNLPEEVEFEDGAFTIEGGYKVRTFAQLPIRSGENYKITIRYLHPKTSNPFYAILFNGDKECMNDFEDERSSCKNDKIVITNQKVTVKYKNIEGKKQQKTEEFPVKFTKEMPMTLTIEKKNKKAIIELNGIEFLHSDCLLTEPCIGFQLFKAGQTLKIDEVIIDQIEPDEE